VRTLLLWIVKLMLCVAVGLVLGLGVGWLYDHAPLW